MNGRFFTGREERSVSAIAARLGVAGNRTRGWSWPGRGSHLLAVLWLGVLSLVCLGGLSRFPYYSPFASVADHPYVYNHMPPGPETAVALLLKDGLFTVFDLHRAK